MFKKFSITFSVIVFMFGIVGPIVAHAAVAPVLGATSTFGVLSSTFTNSNTPPQTIINGDIGYTVAGAPVTPPITVTGALHPADATHTLAGVNQATALAVLNGQPCTPIGGTLDAVVIGTNPPGTFPPGCYSVVGAMDITLSSTVTLDLTAPGGTGNVWIFKSTGALTTGADSFIALANGASECNVFWAPVGGTSIGAFTTGGIPPVGPTFIGTIIDDAGITLGHFANLLGRALSFATTVTTDSNTITVPIACSAAPKLTLQKTIIGGHLLVTDFPLTATGLLATITGVSGTGSVTGVSVPAGSYDLTEVTGSHYTGGLWTCNGGVVVVGHTINLVNGDDITCTIVNTYHPASSGSSSGGSHSISVVPSSTQPSIHVTKTFSPLGLYAGPGIVTYTEKITNPGTITLSNITLTDDTCSPVKYISGDINNNSKLENTETWVYTCQTRLTKTTTNTAVATGEANGVVVKDSVLATVLVVIPGLPQTGLPPKQSNIPWNIIISGGVLGSLVFLGFSLRKQAK